MAYWLMKSEPEVYSIENLKKDQFSLWEGVRNYQARNFMMKDMKLGDIILFYHSNANPSGVAGLGRVSQLAQPDITCLNPLSPYYDEKSTPTNPRWYCVQIEFQEQFKTLIPLDELRKNPKLKEMLLLQKGQRLSIMPVLPKEFDIILQLAKH